MTSDQVDYSDYRMPCEVYSRIVGYLRPTSHWNKGKRQEFSERFNYVMPSASTLDTLRPAAAPRT